jgi:endonuclease/exonuclease/phosphatase family metal-dependent hydrolase
LRSSSSRVRAAALAAAIGVGAIVFPAAADAKPKPIKPSKPIVMTRNLYLGADLTPAIAAPNAPAAYTAIGNIYTHMQDMNFNARAKLLANEIEASNPDLIGLQEVSHWLRDEAVDGPPTEANPNAVPATETVYDYLDILLKELHERGLNYSVAVSQNEADLEFPADTHGPGDPTSAQDGIPDFDARLIMRDVILVKDGVKVKATGHNNYSANAFASTAAFGQVTILRGYAWADVRIDKPRSKGTLFRFVDTHLESFSAYFRNAQAMELVGGSGVTNTVDYPVVLVGDLNSDPDDPSIAPGPPAPTGNNDAYESVIAGGFTDYGLPSGTNTCCFGEDVRDPVPAFDSRIDHVLGKGAVSKISANLIGTDPTNRTGTGLWPTDHGGVVAQLKVG